MSDQDLAKLKQVAASKFSSEEIDNFINVGKKLASKVVLAAVKHVINEGPEKGLSDETAKKLCKKIDKRCPEQGVGNVGLSMTEIPFTLCICLSIVNKGYKTDIDIPSPAYAHALFEQYNFLKQTAKAYWAGFREQYPLLFDKICEYRKDVDFSELVVDSENPTTMYFDALSKKRIGIFCYYKDQNGIPFYKKQKPVGGDG